MLLIGREVRIRRNCARGLDYRLTPEVEGGTQQRGNSFFLLGPTLAGENHFFYYANEDNTWLKKKPITTVAGRVDYLKK